MFRPMDFSLALGICLFLGLVIDQAIGPIRMSNRRGMKPGPKGPRAHTTNADRGRWPVADARAKFEAAAGVGAESEEVKILVFQVLLGLQAQFEGVGVPRQAGQRPHAPALVEAVHALVSRLGPTPGAIALLLYGLQDQPGFPLLIRAGPGGTLAKRTGNVRTGPKAVELLAKRLSAIARKHRDL
jgi:hypothetical protein